MQYIESGNSRQMKRLKSVATVFDMLSMKTIHINLPMIMLKLYTHVALRFGPCICNIHHYLFPF